MPLRRPVGLLALSAVAASALALLPSTAAQATSPDVVLAEAYGGGGNSGAVLRNDFVELANPTDAAVSVEGWAVQYASAAGTTWQVTPLTGSIPAGGRYLVRQAAGSGGTQDLPAPDATGTVSMGASGFKVALTTSTAACSGADCGLSAGNPALRDLLGAGSASASETAPAPAPSNTTSVARTGVDTDDNRADFATGAPTPQGTGGATGGEPTPPPAEACEVTTPTAISLVQGTPEAQSSDTASPLVGRTVTVRGTVVGEVTGSNSGLFLQDPVGDGDPTTSEGVFAFLPQSAFPGFTGSAVPGDVVAVTGRVAEFQGSTQIGSVTSVGVCAAGAVLAPTAVELPESVDGELERYEGMLVTIPTRLTVQQNFFLGRFGQLTLGAGGRLYQPTNLDPAGSDAARATADLNRRSLVVLDDAFAGQNPDPVPFLDAQGTRRAGDTVTGLTGVLDFGAVNSNSALRDYRVQAQAPVAFDAGDNARTAAPDEVGGSLRVSAFNVLNYFTTLGERGADTSEELVRQRDKVFAAFTGLDADVVGLIEIENSEAAVADFVNGLNTAQDAPGRWASVPVPTGGAGDDAIKVTHLYRTDRVELVGGTSYAPTDQTAFANARVPNGAVFRELSSGEVVSTIVNHFKSKGSCPSSGTDPNADQGDGQACFNADRVEQAEALLVFVEEMKAIAGDPRVLVTGDLNAYGDEDPVRVLQAAGMVDLVETHQGEDAYSYVFDGLAGYLDHALATPEAAQAVTGATVWHINADEPSVLDYNTEFKPDDRYAPTPYRSSDHDPVLVGLALRGTPPVADAGGPYAVAPGRTVVLDASASTGSELTWAWDLDADGAFDDATGPRVSFRANRAPGAYPVAVQVSDGSRSAVDETVVEVVTPGRGTGSRPPGRY